MSSQFQLLRRGVFSCVLHHHVSLTYTDDFFLPYFVYIIINNILFGALFVEFLSKMNLDKPKTSA